MLPVFNYGYAIFALSLSNRNETHLRKLDTLRMFFILQHRLWYFLYCMPSILLALSFFMLVKPRFLVILQFWSIGIWAIILSRGPCCFYGDYLMLNCRHSWAWELSWLVIDSGNYCIQWIIIKIGHRLRVDSADANIEIFEPYLNYVHDSTQKREDFLLTKLTRRVL